MIKVHVPCGIRLSALLGLRKAVTLHLFADRLASKARPKKPVLPVTKIRSSMGLVGAGQRRFGRSIVLQALLYQVDADVDCSRLAMGLIGLRAIPAPFELAFAHLLTSQLFYCHVIDLRPRLPRDGEATEAIQCGSCSESPLHKRSHKLFKISASLSLNLIVVPHIAT